MSAAELTACAPVATVLTACIPVDGLPSPAGLIHEPEELSVMPDVWSTAGCMLSMSSGLERKLSLAVRKVCISGAGLMSELVPAGLVKELSPAVLKERKS